MAYSYARRKELAAQRLAALGIDTGGRNPEKVLRTLSNERKAEAVTALAQRQASYTGGGAYRPGRTIAEVREHRKRKRPPLRQDIPQLGARVTTTQSEREIRKALRDAAAKGQHVVVYVTACAAGGGEPRTHIADGKRKYSKEGDDLQGPPVLAGKVQIIAAPPGSDVFGRTDGVALDPSALLEWMKSDGTQAVLCDLWAGEQPGGDNDAAEDHDAIADDDGLDF